MKNQLNFFQKNQTDLTRSTRYLTRPKPPNSKNSIIDINNYLFNINN
jgi:hypothetical protein